MTLMAGFTMAQHRTSDFDFILDGIISILATDLANTANFLPGSRKPVPYILETCEESIRTCWHISDSLFYPDPQSCSSGK